MKIKILNRIKGLSFKWIEQMCVIIVFLALPVYLISNALFETAVLRDKSTSLLERKWIKKLLIKINGINTLFYKSNIPHKEEERADRGLRFSDFAKEIENGKSWFKSQKKERITMTSFDGLKLTAYYLPSEELSRKVLVLMHGYRNEELYDFAGLVRFYHEMGYNLLVPCQRSHGESEGKYICFGVKERIDLKQWTEYMSKRFDGKCMIYLTGISMGGATVLMAADRELPSQVKGIIADCAFTSPWDILARVLNKNCHLPRFPFLYAADLICRRKAGFCFRECSTIKSMKNNKLPVLFIHGGKDDFIPAEMSYQNYEACTAEKRLLIVDEAAHGTSHLAAAGAYRSAVLEFMEQCENNSQDIA